MLKTHVIVKKKQQKKEKIIPQHYMKHLKQLTKIQLKDLKVKNILLEKLLHCMKVALQASLMSTQIE